MNILMQYCTYACTDGDAPAYITYMSLGPSFILLPRQQIGLKTKMVKHVNVTSKLFQALERVTQSPHMSSCDVDVYVHLRSIQGPLLTKENKSFHTPCSFVHSNTTSLNSIMLLSWDLINTQFSLVLLMGHLLGVKICRVGSDSVQVVFAIQFDKQLVLRVFFDWT